MIFKDMDKIVFAGDSVTDMDSNGAVSEAMFDNLGHGYVRAVDNLLSACYPQLRIRVVNAGIGGNTSRDLLNRFDRDVISQNPDWISICIGINDVWRQFDAPAIRDICVYPEEYESNMEKMIVAAKAKAKGVFVLSPYYIEPDKEDAMRAKMDEYVEICRKLAEKYECTFVDFQTLYSNYCKMRHSSFIAWDRVHPNQRGSMLMAKEFLSKCGFEF